MEGTLKVSYNKILLPLLFVLLLTVQAAAIGATIRGNDGRWYGNICLTQAGAVFVPWQLVGSMCYWPAHGIYGFILNQ